MSPGLMGEIEAARLTPHTSAPAPADAVAPPAAVGDRSGSGSPLPTTRRTGRPTLREQLWSMCEQVGRRNDATVFLLRDGWLVVLQSSRGGRVSLGLGLDEGAPVTELGAVRVDVRPDDAADWLRLAAIAADVHREAGRIIAYAHRHMDGSL